MTDDIMKYPEFSSAAFYIFLVLAIIALGGYLWLKQAARKRQGTSLDWNRLQAYGRKRGLDKKQLRFLHAFYARLAEPEQSRVLTDRVFFRGRLRDYLIGRGDVDARLRTRVFQKLFPEIDYRLEVIDASDLQPDELCALTGSRRAGLVRVQRSDLESVRLELLDPEQPGDYPEGMSVHLSAYRPLLGEFVLNGKIYERQGRGIVFRFGGKVDARYETHLMLERRLSIKLEPVVALETRTATPAQPVAEANNEQTGAQGSKPLDANLIAGETDRISDRALAFRLDDGQDRARVRSLASRVELWRCDLTLDDRFTLACAGSLYPGRKPDEYLFRYRDRSETEEQALFNFIKKSGGVRERL